jgi:hypothetical protein
MAGPSISIQPWSHNFDRIFHDVEFDDHIDYRNAKAEHRQSKLQLFIMYSISLIILSRMQAFEKKV